MSWRTLVIRSHCKLDLKLNQIVVRTEKTIRVNISEISLVIIENTAVSVTASLLSELVANKIGVIFCDAKRLPQFQLVPFYGCHNSRSKIIEQINWDEGIKQQVWVHIVKEKIRNQAEILELFDLERANQLRKFSEEVLEWDCSNREGHAAKVYFNGLFGMDFTRGKEIEINAALNYGYAILLSVFAREVASSGYLTQLGIFHRNDANSFNLCSDLMEPFRPLVDIYVKKLNPEDMTPETKGKLVALTEMQTVIGETKQYLPNAVKIYCSSVFDALSSGRLDQVKTFRLCIPDL